MHQTNPPLPAGSTIKRPPPESITIVVPVLNEYGTIPRLIEALEAALAGQQWELLFINDGSVDETEGLLERVSQENPRIHYISLSRNFGKEVALTAGFDHAKGAVVISMDGDLQHPPRLIPQLIEQWQAGYDIVYTVREDRGDETLLKRLFTRAFYQLFTRVSKLRLPENASDFRLMDRKVVRSVRQLREQPRFMKGIYAWVGFKSVELPYTPDRRSEGRSNWGFRNLFNLAMDGLTGFSSIPLKVWSYLGILFSMASLLYAFFLLMEALINGREIPGYATLVVAVFFFGGVQLLSLGIIGEYMARVFIATRGRPLYIVDETSLPKARRMTEPME